MFFKGTERRPTGRDIAGEVDSIGGEFNAFTGKEYTAYYVRCAAEHRDVALDVIVDMLRNSKFDAGEIDREKGVIIEEMNMYFDTPRDFVDGVYEELVYGDHPLGWDIIGRKETVQGATRDSFLDYIGHWYKPSRMVVGVGGRIGDDLVGRIAELFGDLEDAPTGAPLPALISPNGSRVKVHTKASDQAHVCLGVRSRPIADPDRYVLMVLSTVLGGGMSSGSSRRFANAEVSPTTSSPRTTHTPTPVLCTRRPVSTSSGSTTRSRRSRPNSARSRRKPFPMRSS